MKLILIYGPPAVGKLTVAEKLASLTGFKLFHNHVTVDLVGSIFPRGSPSFSRLLLEIRSAVFEEAARAKIDGLIFTMVYTTKRQAMIAHFVDVVKKGGGEACLVHLHCGKTTLQERVVSEERKKYGKITTVELLNETLNKLAEPFSTVSGQASLSINTEGLSPHDAAQKIIAHYKLPILQT